MTDEDRQETAPDRLALRLRTSQLSVSYLSSLLRVVQAALREVALSEDGTRQEFDRRPAPMLVVSSHSGDDEMTLLFAFADPMDSTLKEDLSSRTFNAFLDSFGQFVRSLPQPSLWGGAAPRARQHQYDSQVARRMNQVYRETRRLPKTKLSFQGRTIDIEGDRMEIS